MKKYFIRGINFLLGVIILAIVCMPVQGAETDQTTKIKVAFYQLDGFFEYDENGKECGYGVDYLNELTKYADIEWEYVPVDSWEGIKDMMLDGRVDVKLPVSEPVKPSVTYEYTTEPMMSSYHAIMTLNTRNDLYYQDYEGISGMKIGMAGELLEKTGTGDYLESIGVYDNLVFYDDYNSCRAALDAGEIDGLISNVMDLTDDMKILDKFSVVNNYITTLKGNPCYSIINKAMTKLKLENPSFQSLLYEKYYPERAVEPFTKEEMEYIGSTDHITVAVYTDRRPVSYYDDNNGYQGIAIDIANELSKQIGIPFEYIPITTDTPLGMLDEADLVMPVSQNEDVTKYFVTSNLLNSEILLAIRSGDNEPGEGAKIGVLSSTPGILATMKNLDRFEILEYSSNKDALKALKKGKIDAFANSSYVINWELENPIYDDLRTLRYQSFPITYELCGKTEDSILSSVLNKGIHGLTEDIKDKIVIQDTKTSIKDIPMSARLYMYRHQLAAFIVVMIFIIAAVMVYNHSRTRYIQEIRLSGEQKDKANRAKSEFLARMSHDMRTPLNVIIGMSHLAEDNVNPPDTTECLEKINVASEFLLGLINDVLDMEHIESGKMKLHVVPYSGEEFSQYIASVISPLCQQKNIKFEYTFDGPGNFVIMQDKLRINQVYFNLLSNAVKYTPEGGKVNFHTDIEKTENDTIIMDVSISDTGIGMSEEFMQHMFEPFSQENQVVKPVGEGSGLGLSIVKKICDLMNMSIRAESQLGQGTTFYLHGEYAIASESDLRANEEIHSDSVLDDSILMNKTVLVCEDHPLNQEIIKRQLEKKGIIVELADNGKRGVDIFARSMPGNFAAILMDIRMPVMDGLKATQAIRELARPDAGTIPIIALTANAYEEDVDKCMKAGMNAHLAKPVDPQLMYTTLEKLI